MQLIYDIYGVYLYEDQSEHFWGVLSNERELSSWDLQQCFNDIVFHYDIEKLKRILK